MQEAKTIDLRTNIVTHIDRNGRIQVYNKHIKPEPKKVSNDAYLLPITFLVLLFGCLYLLKFTGNL